MFDKKTYYSYITILDTLTTVMFMLFIIACSLVGLFVLEIKGLIIGLVVSLITSFPVYIFSKIKVEEMKWKLDIYNKIHEKKEV